MYGMACHWPLLIIAFVVGLATAVRPPGVALLLPFAWSVWKESPSASRFLVRSVLLMPFACWGLLSYMGYQWAIFGEPLAFVKTQIHWYHRLPPESLGGALSAYATLQPFRHVYDPSCSCYWGYAPPQETPIFNLQFMNPIYVAFAWIVVGIGAWRRILTRGEVLLAAGLFAIPYVLHAYRACMTAEARYASVVFPVYIVLGHGIAKLPVWLSVCLVSVSVFFLAAYTSLFVAWYYFY